MIAARPGSSSTRRTRIHANLHRELKAAHCVIRMTATLSNIHVLTAGQLPRPARAAVKTLGGGRMLKVIAVAVAIAATTTVAGAQGTTTYKSTAKPATQASTTAKPHKKS